MLKNKFLWLLIFLLASINPLFAQEAYQAHTHVQLVSEQNVIFPGGTFWLGVNFKLDDGWHIYWQNPGDAGLTPMVKWSLPKGFKAGDIDWPYPERLNAGPLTSFGYENQVLLLVPVSYNGKFQSVNHVDFYATVHWLACRDICVPAKVDLKISISMNRDVAKITFSDFKTLFDQTRQEIPRLIPAIKAQAFLEGDQWHLDIDTPFKAQGDVLFYPFRDDVIEHAAPQPVKISDNGYEVLLTKSHLLQETPKALEGIAVNSAGWDDQGTKAIVIQARVMAAMPASPAPVSTGPAAGPAKVSFWLACVFALIGGLILNLMPCVLPVLSIKVLHIIERHPDKQIALQHSLLYTLGVLTSVWALSLLLFILKAAGKFAGWGFQFQSPVFVAVVALVLFVLALNLCGVFEFSAPSIEGSPDTQAGYQASFVNGIITTIVASPCTTPFMGTALTVALSQPNFVGFGIFTCLGLGLALPFVVFCAFPSLLAFVPKPGPWMVYLKRIFGLILFTCVAWLVWVFHMEITNAHLPVVYSAHEIPWGTYSPADVVQARQAGKPVFLDFTAAWCINCQVNDRLVLQNPDVVQAFKDKGVVAFKADWTKYDPVITQALASFGRDSIPVYVYYAPGSDAPQILPQVITPKTILEKINQ